jgi:hypothetical protein
MNSEKIQKSKLALAIEQRERKSHEFDVQGFFGLGDKEIHKVAIRVNTKAEEDAAVVAAHKYAKAISEGLVDAKQDGDILSDGKAIEALFRACRAAGEKSDDESRLKIDYPSFPGPQWMRKNMTTDQIATLLNLYQEVRRVEAPVPWTLTIDEVLNMAKVCAKASDTDIPDGYLGSRPKEWVTQAFIILSERFFALVKEFDLESKVDDWFLPIIEDEEADDVPSEDE